jgi:hypothetical protein
MLDLIISENIYDPKGVYLPMSFRIHAGGPNFGETHEILQLPFGFYHPTAIANGDINGDGFDDLSYTNNDTLFVHYGGLNLSIQDPVIPSILGIEKRQ